MLVVAEVVMTGVETIVTEVAEATIVAEEEAMIVTMIATPNKPKQNQNEMKTRNTTSA